jgi:hypothetical protein
MAVECSSRLAHGRKRRGFRPSREGEEVTQIPDWLDHVGPGWHPLLQQLHTHIAALDPEYATAQDCGSPGQIRNRAGRTWLQCLCDVCIEGELE